MSKFSNHAKDSRDARYYNLSSVANMNSRYSIEIHWRRHVSEGLVEAYLGGEKILEVSGIDTDYFGNADAADFGILSITRVQYDHYNLW